MRKLLGMKPRGQAIRACQLAFAAGSKVKPSLKRAQRALNGNAQDEKDRREGKLVLREAREGWLTMGWENGEYSMESLVRFIHEVGFGGPGVEFHPELNQYARPKRREDGRTADR